MLPVNQVLFDGQLRRRILWSGTDKTVWIDIDAKSAMPEIVSTDNLEELLFDRVAEPIDDPFLENTLREVEEGSVDQIKRDQAWAMLQPIVEDPGLFERTSRGTIVNAVGQKHSVTKQTVYRLLRRYWQRGMKPNALLPSYINSGARGVKRKAGETKRGRPRSIRSGSGTNITPEIEKIFQFAINDKLFKENPPPVSHVYADVLNVLSVKYPHLSIQEQPTIEQFRYFYQQRFHFTETLPRQKSFVDFAKDFRPLKGSSTAEALGPGHRYQFDATIADIYLVSEQDTSLVVGRPVVYMAIDSFSRMIAGIYVGFEGPSWVSAMMALANTITDKVAFCKQYDIDIDAADWPVVGLPEVILADKGELNGTKVETFSEAFGVRIENAPARRGDAKGIVERVFGTEQQAFKPYANGVVEGITSRKRGGRDTRLEANLTLSRFTRQIIACVLHHNNYNTMVKYDRPRHMPANLPAIPLEIWNWGLSALTGKLRTASEDLVRINLLPHDKATVSDQGIRLFGCYYTCVKAIEEGWFHRKQRNNRPGKVTVAYDPRSADHIYLRPSHSLKEYWVCELSDHSRRFRGMTFWDVALLSKKERQSDGDASMSSHKQKGKLIQQLQEINDQAKQDGVLKNGISKKDLGVQVRENKQREKRDERQRTAFRPNKSTPMSKPADVVPIKGGDEKDYSFPDYSELTFGDEDD
ncbi:Transposon Tn7 transposition protein TnsB [Halomonadaceae bacterium LMG 33818]|uniref:Mu transposase C-terminal domain-containing protein n=1 Tax=Cernens ardua TaxID=3402176 RepID=UPI003EDC9087